MSRPKNIRRFWLWVGIGLLIELAVLTLWKRPYWFFPQGEVSEYYTRYAGAHGINAAFVKDYRVNDTLRLDVTVLEVTDSAVWEQVCGELRLLTNEWIMTNVPEEVRDVYFEPGGFESFVLRDTLDVGGKPTPLQTVFIYQRLDRTICIFHRVTEEQYDAIMLKNMDDIEPQGEAHQTPQCDRLPEHDCCGKVHFNGFISFSKGNLLGIADSNGNLLTPAKWKTLTTKDDHLFLEAEGQTYAMDSLGNLTVTDEKID